MKSLSGKLVFLFLATSILASGCSPRSLVSTSPSESGIDEPTATPTPMPTPGSANFPSAANTGPDDGVTLTNYTGSLTISTNGAVIENKIINVPGTGLRITGDNVTIRNCEINDTGDAMFLVSMEGTNGVLEKSIIRGRGPAGNSANAIWVGSDNIVRQNDIFGFGNGPIIDGDNVTIYRNYIHDLAINGFDPHYDGIAMHGVPGVTQNVTIEENTIASRDTSGIFMKDDFGSISNVVIRRNLLLGVAGYQILITNAGSGGSVLGISIIDNYIEEGAYGHIFVEQGVTSTSSGNTLYPAGGAPVPGSPIP